MDRLEKTNYAHQVDDDEQDGNKNGVNDSDEEIEVADNSEAGKDVPQLLGLEQDPNMSHRSNLSNMSKQSNQEYS